MGNPASMPDADVAVQLNRLQKENEILRQEPDILKVVTFFAKEGSRRPGASRPEAANTQHGICYVTPVAGLY